MPILTRTHYIGQSACSRVTSSVVLVYLHFCISQFSSWRHPFPLAISELSNFVWFARSCVIDHQFKKKSGAMADKKMSFFPVVKAQEEAELVDPQATLRDKCSQGKHAQGLYAKLQTCNERVLSRKKTAETCTEELFDYLHVIDHCVTETLWSKLK